MPSVTILGRDFEARPLSALELAKWNSHVRRVFADSYWVELYETIKSLPCGLQQVIVSKSPLPTNLDRLQYFRAATRIDSVKLLVTWMLVDREITRFQVNEGNAVEIFWALQPLILNKPVALRGADALAKLRAELDDIEMTATP